MAADDFEPALDVWLRFDTDDDEEAEAEANTYATDDGFRVEWYHTAVGQVSERHFNTLADAHAWLTRNGFADFTS